MSSEFLCMLQDEHTIHLHRMFLLLQRIEGALLPLTKQFLKHIQNYGFEFIQRVSVSNSLEPNFIITYSETLLEIYLKFNELVSKTFHNHPQFVSALEEGFRIVINSNPIVSNLSSGVTSAQLLAMYCDIILKTSSHVKMDENELEKTLDRCTQLFKFIDSKDIFQKYFSVHLANRLIEDLSCGEEYEQQMIRGLQQTSGMDYTSKLQRMFQDIKIASGLSSQFKEFCENNQDPDSSSSSKLSNNNIDCSVLILTSGSWPLSNQSPSSFHLPDVFVPSVENFEKFYYSHHSGRRLNWIHHCSKGEIHAKLNDKIYQITMPVYMIATILLFNDESILDYTQIQSKTNLSDSELGKILKTLVVSRLLIPDLKKLSKSTKFKVNSQFNHKTLKLKLGNKIQMGKVKQSVNNADITAGRKLLLQAAIVRVMKMRKEATHTQLIQEVLEQASSHFIPEVQQIKKVIEILIDKEYIVRVEGENKYRYLA